MQNFGLLVKFLSTASDVRAGAVVLILTRTISILLHGVPFLTFVMIVMHMVAAAFPAL